MSERDQRPESEDDMLSGAYALDALSDEERALFDRALAGSEDLRSEAAEFADTAAILGDSAPRIDPPASMKVNLMALIAQTPQLPVETPAAVGENAEGDPDVIDDDIRARAVPLRPVPAEASAPATQADGPEIGAAETKARARWFSRPGAIIASAAAALVLIGGAVVGIGYPGANGWGAQQNLASITDATDHQSQTVDATGGGTVTVSWSGERGQAAMKADGLATLDSSETYELWYISEDDGAIPAGTFDVSGDTTWRVLDGSMPKDATIGVTIEPAGGSDTPTTAPIAAVPTVV